MAAADEEPPMSGGEGSGEVGDEQSLVRQPQKRYFRQRAHANPFSAHAVA